MKSESDSSGSGPKPGAAIAAEKGPYAQDTSSSGEQGKTSGSPIETSVVQLADLERRHAEELERVRTQMREGFDEQVEALNEMYARSLTTMEGKLTKRDARVRTLEGIVLAMGGKLPAEEGAAKDKAEGGGRVGMQTLMGMPAVRIPSETPEAPQATEPDEPAHRALPLECPPDFKQYLDKFLERTREMILTALGNAGGNYELMLEGLAGEIKLHNKATIHRVHKRLLELGEDGHQASNYIAELLQYQVLYTGISADLVTAAQILDTRLAGLASKEQRATKKLEELAEREQDIQRLIERSGEVVQAMQTVEDKERDVAERETKLAEERAELERLLAPITEQKKSIAAERREIDEARLQTQMDIAGVRTYFESLKQYAVNVRQMLYDSYKELPARINNIQTKEGLPGVALFPSPSYIQKVREPTGITDIAAGLDDNQTLKMKKVSMRDTGAEPYTTGTEAGLGPYFTATITTDNKLPIATFCVRLPEGQDPAERDATIRKLEKIAGSIRRDVQRNYSGLHFLGELLVYMEERGARLERNFSKTD
ncbi:hypothetical protein KY359_01005 [Candidatus Woesearchaeota archaeon]|nr:hypothetical protein [Candidatus Woesearchaeota archaeon]